MSQHIYTVTGMTCAHCVASVTDEISERTTPLDETEVDAAVREAGYRLAG